MDSKGTGVKELFGLRMMVLNWRDSYMSLVEEGEGGDYLVRDFLDEIESYVYPYVRRLYDCSYICEEEMQEFLDFCMNQVEELQKRLIREEI